VIKLVECRERLLCERDSRLHGEGVETQHLPTPFRFNPAGGRVDRGGSGVGRGSAGGLAGSSQTLFPISQKDALQFNRNIRHPRKIQEENTLQITMTFIIVLKNTLINKTTPIQTQCFLNR
jgi:hypothetical protein